MSKWIVCLCMAVAMGAAWVAGAQERTIPGNLTRRLSRDVRIWSRYSENSGNNAEALKAAVTRFAETEAKKVLPNSDVGIQTAWGEGFIQLGISLFAPPDAPQQALNDLMERIVQEIKNQVEQQAASGRNEQAKRLSEKRTELTNQIKVADADIQGFRQKLRDMTARSDISPEGLREAMSKLDQQQQQLAIDLAGMEARQEALQRTIAEQSKVVLDRVQADPIANELQTVVKVRMQQFDQLKAQHAAGTASNSELSAVAVAMSEAKAKLLERQELVKARAGGDMVVAWNRELLNLSIDRAEKTAKAKYIEKQLAAFRDVDTILLMMSERQEQRQALQRELDSIQKQISALELQPAPTVTVH